MNTKTLTFRRAAASDLDAVTAIYDKIHAQEDAGRVTIGWVTGVYPTRLDAELAFGRNDLYVCETEGRVAASGILNQKQVDVYAEGCGPTWRRTAACLSCTRCCRSRPVQAGDWPRGCAIL